MSLQVLIALEAPFTAWELARVLIVGSAAG